MKRDRHILEHIIRYANDIEEANRTFNADFSVLESNRVYRHAVSHCIEQIGELAGHLSEEFRNDTSKSVAWREIKGIRNISAHDYVNVDNQILWNTINKDIPELKAFCLEQINKPEDI